MHSINEESVLNRFHSYQKNSNIQEAFELLLSDAIDEGFSDKELSEVAQEIVPQIIYQFAETYSNLSNCYDGKDRDPSDGV